MSTRVTVSVVTFTQTKLAMLCISALRKYSPDVKLILTANGSIEAFKAFDAMPNRTLIFNKTNEGFGKPHNSAMSVCDTEFMVCLNDDCIVGPKWLEPMIAAMDADPKVALVGPAGTPARLDANFRGQKGGNEYCEGSCLMVRCSVAQAHGLFDPMLPGLAYCEDSDLSLRYRQRGYKLAWAKVPAVHFVARTSRTIPETKLWQQLNQEFMKKRWADYLAAPDRKFPIER